MSESKSCQNISIEKCYVWSSVFSFSFRASIFLFLLHISYVYSRMERVTACMNRDTMIGSLYHFSTCHFLSWKVSEVLLTTGEVVFTPSREMNTIGFLYQYFQSFTNVPCSVIISSVISSFHHSRKSMESDMGRYFSYKWSCRDRIVFYMWGKGKCVELRNTEVFYKSKSIEEICFRFARKSDDHICADIDSETIRTRKISESWEDTPHSLSIIVSAHTFENPSGSCLYREMSICDNSWMRKKLEESRSTELDPEWRNTYSFYRRFCQKRIKEIDKSWRLKIITRFCPPCTEICPCKYYLFSSTCLKLSYFSYDFWFFSISMPSSSLYGQTKSTKIITSWLNDYIFPSENCISEERAERTNLLAKSGSFFWPKCTRVFRKKLDTILKGRKLMVNFIKSRINISVP